MMQILLLLVAKKSLTIIVGNLQRKINLDVMYEFDMDLLIITN